MTFRKTKLNKSDCQVYQQVYILNKYRETMHFSALFINLNLSRIYVSLSSAACIYTVCFYYKNFHESNF